MARRERLAGLFRTARSQLPDWSLSVRNRGCQEGVSSSGLVRRNDMKTLVSVVAVAVALALTGPAFAAGDVTKAKTAAECAKAGGIWNAATNICTAKKM